MKHLVWLVLMHGLARSASSFKTMEAFLNSKGYQTLNIDYPSTDYPIETLCREHVAPEIKKIQKESGGPLAYVTHSMGGKTDGHGSEICAFESWICYL